MASPPCSLAAHRPILFSFDECCIKLLITRAYPRFKKWGTNHYHSEREERGVKGAERVSCEEWVSPSPPEGKSRKEAVPLPRNFLDFFSSK